jgi:ketosteroid isomerase-like protein
MDTNTTTDATATTTDGNEQLPRTIRAFDDAHAARDADAALTLMATGAVISDLGESFTGEEALRHFISEAGAEFTYTDDIIAVSREGEVWVVTHHLEGDFPGGTADLNYRFVLDGEQIGRLDIVGV